MSSKNALTKKEQRLLLECSPEKSTAVLFGERELAERLQKKGYVKLSPPEDGVMRVYMTLTSEGETWWKENKEVRVEFFDNPEEGRSFRLVSKSGEQGDVALCNSHEPAFLCEQGQTFVAFPEEYSSKVRAFQIYKLHEV